MEKKYTCPNCGAVTFSAIPAEFYEDIVELCEDCEEAVEDFYNKH